MLLGGAMPRRKIRPQPSRENLAFSREYAEVAASLPVLSESTDDVELPVKEKLLRCLWFEQYFDTARLTTVDGRAIRLHSPGYWNTGSGPDFRNGEIAFGDGPTIRGDVELHIKASGWRQHGHASDPAYANVILHVILENDRPAATIRHDVGEIPQLVLGMHLSADLSEIIGSLNPDTAADIGAGREGPCCRSARVMGRDGLWVGRFLDMAGDERMLRKADRMGDRIRIGTADDVLYAGLMDCMGFSANRGGFGQLAQAAPLRDLRRWVPVDAPLEERRVATQAILFGVSGFLDRIKEDALEDDVTRERATALRATWEAVKSGWPHPIMEKSAWVLHRTRPTNHPVRRIPAVAAFLAAHLHSGLCRALMMTVEGIPAGGSESALCRQTLDCLCALFEESPDAPEESYWTRRTGFGSPTLTRPNRLIGPTRATEIVVNTVVPLLLALSESMERPSVERRLHNLYTALRPLADNAVTKYMKSRVFTDPEQGKLVVKTVRRQQGLLQLFHDFCETTDRTCTSCGFLAAVEDRNS
jgi:Protein of unknown function (DUF2851)